MVWWPTIHLGLNRYYNELRNHGEVPQPLPTSYIRHHPAGKWGLAHGWPEYMPFEVRSKQHLLELSETDLYLRLLDLQQQFNASAGQMPCVVKRDPVRIYEIKDIIEDPAWKRKRSASIDFGSEASSSAEVELTSDGDFLEQQKRRQYKVVRQVEERMRAGIEKDREKRGSLTACGKGRWTRSERFEPLYCFVGEKHSLTQVFSDIMGIRLQNDLEQLFVLRHNLTF